MEKSEILDSVLPMLQEIKLGDITVLVRVVSKYFIRLLAINRSCKGLYQLMLSDKKYGLSSTILATKVVPALVPQLVSLQLDMETYTLVLTTIQQMLDVVDK